MDNNEERNMKEIVVDGVRYAPVHTGQANANGHPYCIVRCKNAGVHAGYVSGREDGVVTLTHSRRIRAGWHSF
jgi:hypothetical protein